MSSITRKVVPGRTSSAHTLARTAGGPGRIGGSGTVEAPNALTKARLVSYHTVKSVLLPRAELALLLDACERARARVHGDTSKRHV